METFTPRSRSKVSKDSPNISEDSIPSVIFPQTIRCKHSQRRPTTADVELDNDQEQLLNLYIFFVVVIQLVSSCCIIGLVIVFMAMNYRHGLIVGLNLNLPLYLFLTSGLLFLLGSYLCMLSHNYYRAPLTKHIISSLIVIIINMICLITVIIYGNKTNYELKYKTLMKFKDSFDGYYSSASSHTFFNEVQNKFNCCGVNNADEWSIFQNDLPQSCCHNFSSNGSCTEWNQKGCYEVYYANMYSYVNFIIGFSSVALVIAAISVIPISISYHVTKKDKNVTTLFGTDISVKTFNNSKERNQENSIESPNLIYNLGNDSLDGLISTVNNNQQSSSNHFTK